MRGEALVLVSPGEKVYNRQNNGEFRQEVRILG